MKQIAFISHFSIVPADSGNRQRILTLVRAVKSLGYDVRYFFITEDDVDDELIEKHNSIFHPDFFSIIRLKKSALDMFIYKIHHYYWAILRRIRRKIGMTSGYYHSLDEVYSPYYTKELRKVTANTRFDAVFVEYVFASAAFEAFKDTPVKVLDTHDAFADRHLKFLHTPNPAKAYWFSVPPAEEVRAFRRADVVVAIQDDEAEDFRKRIGPDGPEVVTVSHFITIPESSANYEAADAVFIGSGGDANIESVTWFTEKVLPLIKEQAPAFRLHLVGSICKAVPDHKDLVKHNFLDDLADAYRFGSITINPTRIGTGINIKLLDAMACGSPTVASSFGVRGLPERFRQGVIEAGSDEPQTFADRMIELIKDTELRQRAGQRARQAAIEWNREQTTNLQAILDRIS